MKASLRSVRIAPKKANIVAKMVRGLPVDEAIRQLERTNKKAARMIEELIKSAVANAKHNDDQNPTGLVIKGIIVNQGTALHRGVPMARGRIRPMRKFMSHIDVTLGVNEERAPAKAAATSGEKPARKTAAKKPSQKAANEVKTSGTNTTSQKDASSEASSSS